MISARYTAAKPPDLLPQLSIHAAQGRPACGECSGFLAVTGQAERAEVFEPATAAALDDRNHVIGFPQVPAEPVAEWGNADMPRALAQPPEGPQSLPRVSLREQHRLAANLFLLPPPNAICFRRAERADGKRPAIVGQQSLD